MDLKDLKALNLTASDTTIDTDLGDGQIISQHPAGPTMYVKYVIRRNKSIRAQFLAPSKMMKAASASAKGEEAAMASIDWEANAEAAIEDRIEADTTLIALTLCRPRKLQDLVPFEEEVSSWNPKAFRLALKGAQDVTFGENPQDFFAEVSQSISGMDLMMGGQSLPNPPTE